jgi:hypothetical protein
MKQVLYNRLEASAMSSGLVDRAVVAAATSMPKIAAKPLIR